MDIVVTQLLVASLDEDVYGLAQQRFADILKSLLAAEIQLTRFMHYAPQHIKLPKHTSAVRYAQIIFKDPHRFLKGRFYFIIL
jgi:hypothetical protein